MTGQKIDYEKLAQVVRDRAGKDIAYEQNLRKATAALGYPIAVGYRA